MAKKIVVLRKLCPAIELRPSVGMKELVEYIGGRTGLNKGEIQIVLSELSDSIQFYCKQGQGVKIDGLGTYLPKVNTKGKFSISHRLDAVIRNKLNSPGEFRGEISNRENIGKSQEEICAEWDRLNPDDLVEDLVVPAGAVS